MAALPLWWVSPHAVNYPCFPAKLSLSQGPVPCAVLLHVVGTRVGVAQRCDASFPSCLSGSSLSKGSRCFWPLHPHLHTAPLGTVAVLAALTHFSPCGVGFAAALGNGHPNTFPLSPPDSPLAMCNLPRGKFQKQPFVAVGLPPTEFRN